MSDLTKLKEILNNQAERGIKSGDWKRLDYKEDSLDLKEFDITLRIENVEIGFVFTKRGRLLGIYTWKE